MNIKKLDKDILYELEEDFEKLSNVERKKLNEYLAKKDKWSVSEVMLLLSAVEKNINLDVSVFCDYDAEDLDNYKNIQLIIEGANQGYDLKKYFDEGFNRYQVRRILDGLKKEIKPEIFAHKELDELDIYQIIDCYEKYKIDVSSLFIINFPAKHIESLLFMNKNGEVNIDKFLNPTKYFNKEQIKQFNSLVEYSKKEAYWWTNYFSAKELDLFFYGIENNINIKEIFEKYEAKEDMLESINKVINKDKVKA